MRLVCPDTDGIPIYLLPASQYPDFNIWRGDMCGGLYGRYLDLAAADKLVTAGKWHGRGIGLYINDSILPDHNAALFARLFTAVCLHELCHWVTMLDAWREATSVPISAADIVSVLVGDLLRGEEQTFLAKIAAPESEAPDLPDTISPPWAGHGASFIRACCHLRHRALHADRWIEPLSMYYAGASYGLSGPRRYEASLCGEPENKRSWPIEQVLQSPAPDRFLELWQSDTAAK